MGEGFGLKFMEIRPGAEDIEVEEIVKNLQLGASKGSIRNSSKIVAGVERVDRSHQQN
jgi:hypothetical protein